jgi:NADH-quinone oxidoreductase subunit G
VPTSRGRDTDAILAAAASGELEALVVGGVEVRDLPDPVAAQTALDKVGFLVSLEVRTSDVTAVADVILPVAPVSEKSGSFVNWEGRIRPFERVLESSALTDTRVLAGVSDELDRSLGYRTVEAARSEMREIGPWDGERAAMGPAVGPNPTRESDGSFFVSTWRLLIDDSRAVDGEPHLRATGRRPVAVLSAAALARLGVGPGDSVTVSTDIGHLTVPVVVGDIDDAVVWLPANSGGVSLPRRLGVGAGGVVTVRAGEL